MLALPMSCSFEVERCVCSNDEALVFHSPAAPHTADRRAEGTKRDGNGATARHRPAQPASLGPPRSEQKTYAGTG